jgi:hypothetical protein
MRFGSRTRRVALQDCPNIFSAITDAAHSNAVKYLPDDMSSNNGDESNGGRDIMNERSRSSRGPELADSAAAGERQIK